MAPKSSPGERLKSGSLVAEERENPIRDISWTFSLSVSATILCRSMVEEECYDRGVQQLASDNWLEVAKRS